MANDKIKSRKYLLTNSKYLIEHVFQKRVKAADTEIKKIEDKISKINEQKKFISTAYNKQTFDPVTLEILPQENNGSSLYYTEKFQRLTDITQNLLSEYKKISKEKEELIKPLQLLQNLLQTQQKIYYTQIAIDGADNYIRINGANENVQESRNEMEEYDNNMAMLKKKQEEQTKACLNNPEIEKAVNQLIIISSPTRARNF